jgi:hypothetical protein
MDEWMNGWMNECMNEWINEWMRLTLTEFLIATICWLAFNWSDFEKENWFGWGVIESVQLFSFLILCWSLLDVKVSRSSTSWLKIALLSIWLICPCICVTEVGWACGVCDIDAGDFERMSRLSLHTVIFGGDMMLLSRIYEFDLRGEPLWFEYFHPPPWSSCNNVCCFTKFIFLGEKMSTTTSSNIVFGATPLKKCGSSWCGRVGDGVEGHCELEEEV